MSRDPLEEKISIARTRLLLDRPFLGALTLRLPLVEANGDWCATTATDMRNIYFNRAYLDALGPRQIEFVLAHEALHCGLAHFARRGHRDKHRWDLACDFAINPVLIEEGLRPPPNAVTFFEYAGLSAEEIYPLLQDNEDQESMDQHLDGSAHDGASSVPPTSGPEREALAQQWQQHLVTAAQRAVSSGKLSGTLARWMNELLQPRLPWRALLAQFMRTVARDDYSYMRPARRESNAILPSLRSHGIDVVVALDVSGSITDAELAEFIAEVDALKGRLNARVTIVICDREVRGVPEVYEAWETLRVPSTLPRGGDTDFRPVFSGLDAQSISPDVLVYFTDACGQFPDHAPAYPVCWIVKGKQRVPWGTRVQLN